MEALPDSLMLLSMCSMGASANDSASRPRMEVMVEEVRDALRPIMIVSVGFRTAVGLKVKVDAILVAVLLRFMLMDC